jgi:hypothetical protein
LIFRPGFNEEVVIGNDGGIYYSPNFGNSSTSNFTLNNSSARNTNYNVTQYYSVAMKNITGDGYLLGGTQDNGSHAQNSGSLTQIGSAVEVLGGDGFKCFIDQDNPNIQIVSNNTNVSSHYLLPFGTVSTLTYLGSSNSWFLTQAIDYSSSSNTLYSSLWDGCPICINNPPHPNGLPQAGYALFEKISNIGNGTPIKENKYLNIPTIYPRGITGQSLKISPYNSNIVFHGNFDGVLFKISANPVF